MYARHGEIVKPQPIEVAQDTSEVVLNVQKKCKTFQLGPRRDIYEGIFSLFCSVQAVKLVFLTREFIMF